MFLYIQHFCTFTEGLEVTFGAYQESWQTGDIDKFLSYYAEDVKFFCNDIPGVLVGRESK